MYLLRIASLFLLIFSCSKEKDPPKAKVQISFSQASLSAGTQQGGVIILARPAGNGVGFLRQIGDETDSFSRDLEIGFWDFAAIAWDGDGGGLKLEGTTSCGFLIGQEITLDTAQVQITLTQADCGGVGNEAFNDEDFMAGNQFKPLNIYSCQHFDGIDFTADECENEYRGVAKSFTVNIPEGQYFGGNFLLDSFGVETRCLPLNDFNTATNNGTFNNGAPNVTVPAGVADSFALVNIPIFILGFANETCDGDPVNVFTFFNGLAQETFDPDFFYVLSDYDGQGATFNLFLRSTYLMPGSVPDGGFFGENGFELYDADGDTAGDDFINAVTYDPVNDRIYAVGEVDDTGASEGLILGLNPDGTDAPGFPIQFNFGGANAGLHAVEVDPAGNLYVGGYRDDGADSIPFVAKFDDTGAIDGTFASGTSGLLFFNHFSPTDFESTNSIVYNTVTNQLIVGGNAHDTNNSIGFLANVDPTIGTITGGQIPFNFALYNGVDGHTATIGDNFELTDLAVNSNTGEVFVVGIVDSTFAGQNSEQAFINLRDSSLNNISFSLLTADDLGGEPEVNGGSEQTATAVVFDVDTNRYYVAGETTDSGDERAIVYALDTAGAPDTSFNGTGITDIFPPLPECNNHGPHSYFNDLAIIEDFVTEEPKILAVGGCGNSPTSALTPAFGYVVQYNMDGTVDTEIFEQGELMMEGLQDDGTALDDGREIHGVVEGGEGFPILVGEMNGEVRPQADGFILQLNTLLRATEVD